MLNPDLDLASLRAEFQKTRHVRIRDFLQRGDARAAVSAFPTLPWKLFAADGSGVRIIESSELEQDVAKQRTVQAALMNAASNGEGFAYFGTHLKLADRRVVTEGPLARLCDTLESAEVLNVIRAITETSDFDAITAQASQFRPGHYLTRHNDAVPRERRKYAFVLGLTESWHPDWGGLLQFFARQGDATHSHTPAFNTFDLFDVSEAHSVTYIAPFARAPRLAVSGWFVKS